jgi:hypothetical protein
MPARPVPRPGRDRDGATCLEQVPLTVYIEDLISYLAIYMSGLGQGSS